MKKKILFLALVIGLAGCANFSSKEQLSKLALKRAAYDLSCKEIEIKITELQDKRYGGLYDDFSEEVMYGAEGCGQKQTYQVTNPEYSQPMVYKEGAAPDPVIVQGLAPGIQSYTPAPIHHSIGKPYSGIGSFK